MDVVKNMKLFYSVKQLLSVRTEYGVATMLMTECSVRCIG